MVSINYAFREICCKIVYYGPGLSGKTTNLIYIHKKAPPQTRGELISLATDADRTLYFDFLPLDIGQVQGFTTKFQLYTVPGQIYYNATRKLVLRGVDGLIFVADSQEAKLEENIESMHNLVENLNEYGYDLEELPMIVQYNKRDLEGITSIEELERILNPRKLPYFEAVAYKGIGVFDTLKSISKKVLDKARNKSEPKKKEKKELVSVIAQQQVATPAFVRVEEIEIKSPQASVPVMDNDKDTEEKVYYSTGLKDDAGKTEVSNEIREKEKEISIEPVKSQEILDKEEELRDQEKTKDQNLIRNQEEISKEMLKMKKAMEEMALNQLSAKIHGEKIAFSPEKKVMVSPMLKQKKTKPVRAGFLRRWFEKITGRR